jgi:DNA polymerase III delta subunit
MPKGAKMIHIYYGDDRIKAQQAIVRLLGKDYEVFDGAELTPSDLPSLFQGTSLFNESRKILIKDFSENKSISEKLTD